LPMRIDRPTNNANALFLAFIMCLASCFTTMKAVPKKDGGVLEGPSSDRVETDQETRAQGIDTAYVQDLGKPADSTSNLDVPIIGSDSSISDGQDGYSVYQETGGKGGTDTDGNIVGAGGANGGTGGNPISGTGGIIGMGGSTTNSDTPPALLSNGNHCTVGVACESGFCVDGVCCNIECSSCSACTRALTGQADGSCAPVSAGLDPHNTCTDETATNQCSHDGTCDGNGACRKVGTGHECLPASCTSNSYTPASHCNGNGACTAAPPQDCGPFKCSVTDGCKRTCTSQDDCSSTSYCNVGTGLCLTKTEIGNACTQSIACLSGSCVDGVCCENTCTGTCKACSTTKTGASNGLCRPMKGYCYIGNSCYRNGDDNPDNSCQHCNADSNSGEWINRTNTWFDKNTSLCWERQPTNVEREWITAGEHCDDGWRLPNIDELISIIRGCRAGNSSELQALSICTMTPAGCALNGKCTDCNNCGMCTWGGGPDSGNEGCYWEPELDGNCDIYLSSSPDPDYTNQGWVVSFNYGFTGTDSNGYIRCVRGGN
jgi:hypothetical protein